MEEEKKALKVLTTTTADVVLQMNIDLNRILEAQAAQARREREPPVTQYPPSSNEIFAIFRKINPTRPISKFP